MAAGIALPNIRSMFIPDSGYVIGEADLSGADARVVAWEAEDEDLKSAFRSGMNVHVKNVRDVFPVKVKGWSDEAIKATSYPGGIYLDNKKAVHASNYGGSPKGLAPRLGWTVKECEDFQRNWFGLHPGIRAWQNRVEDQLHGRLEGFPGRSVSNRFGYRIVYFDRIEGLLPEALAWTPQSTVAINCFLGGLELEEKLPWVQLLLQVHDSLVFQYPIAMRNRLDEIKQALHNIVVPYDDPLVIPWSYKESNLSWGEAKDVDW